MATKIRPLQDRLIVKRVKEEEKTKGGIIIPDSAKEKPVEGEVLAVRHEVRRDRDRVDLPFVLQLALDRLV